MEVQHPGHRIATMHVITAREETALQIAHCTALHKKFDEQRRTLKRESARESAALHRLASRLDAEHAPRRRAREPIERAAAGTRARDRQGETLASRRRTSH